MNDKPNPISRRQVRMSLIASLAAVLTLSLTLFAGAGPKAPSASEPRLSTPDPVATAPENAPDNTNDSIGCGCAESCSAAD